MKHKVLKEFPYLMENKKIIVLKIGTILNEYIHTNSNGSISIDKDIVDNNMEYFEVLDWKSELVVFLKNSKIPQPSIMGKKLQPFIQDMFITNSQSSSSTIQIQDNPEHLKIIESLKKDIEELNNLLRKKESSTNRALDEREKDLEFREEQLKKRKERLEDLDFELENRTKEVKNKEFEVLTWENRVNQSISTLDELIKQAENIPTVIEQPQVQVAQEVQKQWDGVYRGMH